MADTTAAELRKLTKRAGPGVPGAEHNTPLTTSTCPRAMSRSSSRTLSGSFGRLGAGPKQGIAPDAIMNVNLGRPNQAWTDDGWTNTDDPAEGSTWCCYVVGDTTTCHQH